ncbi:MAG: hypothetical protein ACRELB_00130, partial [Polyangiaceae bacterium]
MSRARLALAALVVIAALVGCSHRAGIWGTPPPSQLSAFGLASAVVVLDDPTHRAVALVARGDQRVDEIRMPIGHTFLSAAVSPDLTRLFVLSAGDQPRKTDQDEYPSLTLIDATTPAVQSTRYEMSEPLGNLAIDPLGHWAAAFAGSGTPTSFVENPNQIVLFDLTQPPSATNPVSRTLRSFGGAPARLTFTPEVQLASGQRRLLIVETDRDVTLLDLDHAADDPPRPEITVRLTNGSDTRVLQPAGV